MSLYDITFNTLEVYRANVKPHIESNETIGAQIEMRPIIASLREDEKDLRKYHSSESLFWKVEYFENHFTNKNSEMPADTYREFEVYLAQTCLAIRSGNKY